jgi:diaminohydroxyphosphoribosylaminopyrimidine deaminase/5-amino-6-(5-phosphoribosylamino)uracil reductase
VVKPGIDLSRAPMERALALARHALGTTSPNPTVGAVIVKEGAVVGQGYTLPRGQHHAEIVALNDAGPATRGATLYTTLEPCCHYGRTPPCTKAIIAAGITKVHVAITDPNPKVSGQGNLELEQAGIEVVQENSGEARELYEAFARHISTGLPFLTAKFAMSLDGKIASHTGDSQWVTGLEARALVQRMRKECDAVMVGINTVLADDPQLTARDRSGVPRERQPLRVVLDSHARTPPGSRILREPGATLIFTLAEASLERVNGLERAGAVVIPTRAGPDGRVDLREVLAELGRRDVVSLLVEGGGIVLGSLFDAGLVDKLQAFIAPVIIGGEGAASPVEGRGVLRLADSWRLERTRLEAIGTDWLVTGYPVRRG